MNDIPTTITATPDYLLGVDGGHVVCVPVGADLTGGASTSNRGVVVGTVVPGAANGGTGSGGGGGTWGSITGTLSSQTDLNTSLTAARTWGNMTGTLSNQTDLNTSLNYAANGRAMRLAVVGDSIALESGKLSLISPLFWSLVRAPRLFSYSQGTLATPTGGNFAVSGSRSGTLLNTSAAVGYTGTASDLNHPTMVAALSAYAPEVLFVMTGTNDTSVANLGYDQTYNNVKAVWDTLVPLGLKYMIVVPILPRTSLTQLGAVMGYAHRMRALERLGTGVRVCDPSYVMLDDTTTYQAKGGVGGLAGDMTAADGLHPAMQLGRDMEPSLTRVFDELRIPRVQPLPVGQLDVYNQTTNKEGNILGTAGTFAGTGGTAGANASGSVATGWTLSTSNAELTVVGSKGTLPVRGANHTAQILTFGGSALTALRTCTLLKSVSGTTNFELTRAHIAQIIASFKNMAGCTGIAVEFGCTGGSSYPTNRMGHVSAQTAAASHDLPTSATEEVMEMVYPGTLTPLGTNTGINVTITVTFRSGSTPAGVVALAQAGMWGLPTP